MKIIGCFGQMAAGKDTVVDYLVKQSDKWKKVGFADALKNVFMNSFDVNREFIEKWKRRDEIPPGFNLNVRKSLQQIGDGFRKIQSDVWINIVMRNNINCILSDGRYINEAIAIKENYGFNILFWRKDFENDDPNPSESQIKPFVDYCLKYREEGPLMHEDMAFPNLEYFDFFLKNDGSLDDLYGKIDKFLVPCLKSKGF